MITMRFKSFCGMLTSLRPNGAAGVGAVSGDDWAIVLGEACTTGVGVGCAAGERESGVLHFLGLGDGDGEGLGVFAGVGDSTGFGGGDGS